MRRDVLDDPGEGLALRDYALLMVEEVGADRAEEVVDLGVGVLGFRAHGQNLGVRHGRKFPQVDPRWTGALKLSTNHAGVPTEVGNCSNTLPDIPLRYDAMHHFDLRHNHMGRNTLQP